MGDMVDRLREAEAGMLDDVARHDLVLWRALRTLGAAMVLVGAAAGGFAAYEGATVHGAGACVLAGAGTFVLAGRPGWPTLKACLVLVSVVPITATALSASRGVPYSVLPVQCGLILFVAAIATALGSRYSRIMKSALRQGARRLDEVIAEELVRGLRTARRD